MEAEMAPVPKAGAIFSDEMAPTPEVVPKMEARFGLLPFWSAEMEAEMEARFGLLPFWLAEMEARFGLLPLCFHFSRAARLNTVDTGTSNRMARSRSGSLPDS